MWVTKIPPIMGPRHAAVPPIIAAIPVRIGRLSRGTMSVMTSEMPGVIIEAPMPAVKRPKMNITGEFERPAIREPTAIRLVLSRAHICGEHTFEEEEPEKKTIFCVEVWV